MMTGCASTTARPIEAICPTPPQRMLVKPDAVWPKAQNGTAGEVLDASTLRKEQRDALLIQLNTLIDWHLKRASQ